jgi:hypothetical protein
MTHAHIYQLGMKAYLFGRTLTDCPYDPALCSEAYDAWRDGWLDASRAHWRRHSLAIAALRHEDREVSIAKPWSFRSILA